MSNVDKDKIRDIAIKCVDKMVREGIIKDCTDTNDTTEFYIQDIIVEQIKEVYDESSNLSSTKQSVLADIEGLDMLKDLEYRIIKGVENG